MSTISMRAKEKITELYERHIDTVYRVCFTILKNTMDTEDAVQNTFIKLINSEKAFGSVEHERAWLIVTATNTCRDMLRHRIRLWGLMENYKYEVGQFSSKPDCKELLESVLSMPIKYKTVIYLYYYEGYSGSEIASMLGKPPSTVRNLIHRGRKILKDKLGDDFYADE